MPRFHCPQPLATGLALALPPAAARHVQVLRLQPGATITLFDGRGGEYDAEVRRMGRSDVDVVVGAHHAVEREAGVEVHLAVGMPANDRMDWLVEKATELGAASLQPLVAQRSVVRLEGERAAKRQAHWQSIAQAACEQCGRNRVPVLHPVRPLRDWLAASRARGWVLSLEADALPIARGSTTAPGEHWMLNGPEGGLAPEEEAAARAAGWQPVRLGARVLRAETAPLAALAYLALAQEGPAP